MSATTAACPGCADETTQVFQVEGLDCATEVSLIERHLARAPGVCSVRASAVTGQATVVHTLPPGSVEGLLAEVGLKASVNTRAPAPPLHMGGTLLALGLALAGLVAGLRFPAAAVALYLPAILIGGVPVARRGWQRARKGTLDMNALMTVAVVGAMAIGEWARARPPSCSSRWPSSWRRAAWSGPAGPSAGSWSWRRTWPASAAAGAR